MRAEGRIEGNAMGEEWNNGGRETGGGIETGKEKKKG